MTELDSFGSVLGLGTRGADRGCLEAACIMRAVDEANSQNGVALLPQQAGSHFAAELTSDCV